MKTIFLDEQTLLPAPCVATIGFFDGVHRGHRFLIQQVTRVAREAGLASMVITFDRHPRQVLQSDYIPGLLTTTGQKLRLLSATDVDHVVVLPFTRQMAGLTAQQFMSDILHHRLHVRRLMIGYDNRFGCNREEGFDDYVRYGVELGIEVMRNDEWTGLPDVEHVSSSYIRRLIREGDMEAANCCLGRPYALEAHVVGGFKEGRRLGFPTANLDMDEVSQLLPAHGVYVVKVQVDGTGEWYRGMTSIGTRPTYGGRQLTIETNILEGFNRDIYGKRLSVDFYKRIRSEETFGSLDLLQAQLAADAQYVNDYFSKIEDL